MADNTALNIMAGGDSISTDDLGTTKVQRVKVQYGVEGVATDVNASTPLPVTTASLPLPTGAATSGSQLPNNHNVVVTSAPTTAVTAAALPLPTGAATSAAQTTGNTSIASVDTKTPALGQALAAASVPVILPSATVTTLTPPAAITGFATAAKQPALGTAGTASVDVITIQGKAAMTPVLVDPSGVTSPVSLASVPSHAVTNAGTFAAQATAVAATTGGYTPGKLISAASTNATSVKASAGTLGFLAVGNINASPRYVKFYNKASAPTVGTDTPVAVFTIPGNTAGAGSNIPLPPQGLAFSTGIAFAITGGITDADTTNILVSEVTISYGTI